MRNPRSDYWARKCCEKVDGLPLWVVACHVVWDGQCAFKHDGKCEGPLEVHHLFSCGCKRLRYNPRNLMLLCRTHHTGSARWTGHQGGMAMLRFLDSPYPELSEWVEKTAPRLHDPAFLQVWDWQADYEDLRKIVDHEEEYRGTCDLLGMKP